MLTRCTRPPVGPRLKRAAPVVGLSLGWALGCTALVSGLPAAAQDLEDIDFSVPGVQVDLSVLEDSGQRAAISPTARGGTSSGPKGHLLPGEQSPVSTLYITPDSQFEPLAAPPQQARMAPILTPPKPPATKTPPAPAPAPAQVAAPKPAPMPKLPAAMPEPPAPVVEAPALPEPPAPPPAAAMPEPVVAETAAVEPGTQPATSVEKAPEEAPAPPPTPLTPVVAEPTSVPAPPAPPAQAPRVTAELPPAAEPAAEAAPSVAALTPSLPTYGGGDSLTINFDAESAKLSGDARAQLQELAKTLRSQESLRLQLLAYAGNADTSSITARRLALSRALTVRSLLIESGVRSTRIDVRALGNKTTDTNTERVDIAIIER